VIDLKKNILHFMIILLCIIGADSRPAEAYSITLQKDGIYAEMLPDSVVNSATAFFEQNVKKAMKYYNKYKKADDYTYVSKVPDEYRDFIPVAKQIQDSDEIIIRNPFFIYAVGGNATYSYYFFAEKNGKNLCLFSINIVPETGETFFWYDKMMDRYFTYDEKTMGKALFYEIDQITYAETLDKTNVVRNQKVSGEEMIRVGEDDLKALESEFRKKNYIEKKEEIFTYLEKVKKNRVIKKSEKNLKSKLKDEYAEPEKDAKESGRTGIYIVASIGILAIGVIIGGIIFMKKRKKE